jgi:peptide/nickel transport system permease protein
MSAQILPTRSRPATTGIGRFWDALFERMGVLGLIAIGIVLIVVLGAVLAPVLALYDPTVGSVTERYSGMSAAHLLGTDQAGRDIFSRLLWGARSSLTGPLIVVGVTAVFGTLIALVSVWWGGRLPAQPGS